MSGATFALHEIRRHGIRGEKRRLRHALVVLESALNDWSRDASRMNYLAERWATGLPATAERWDEEAILLDEEMEITGFSQSAAIDIARERFLYTAFSSSRYTEADEMTTEDVLRIYAPEVFGLAPLLVNRQRLLREGIPAELQRRWRAGGRAAVDNYLAELRRSQEGVEQFRRELAAFIAKELPLLKESED